MYNQKYNEMSVSSHEQQKKSLLKLFLKRQVQYCVLNHKIIRNIVHYTRFMLYSSRISRKIHIHLKYMLFF